MTLRCLTAGESHGKGLVGILEGVPAGLEIDAAYIDLQLKRRKLGFGRGARQAIEPDAVQIWSGVRHGATLGSPIAMLVENRDWPAWQAVMQTERCEAQAACAVRVPRPGHADLPGAIKYSHADLRNVMERSSARETTMRVALGSVARRLIEACGVQVASRVLQVGSIEDASAVEVPVEGLNARADASPMRCLGAEAEAAMMAEVERCRELGDTIGGIFEVRVGGVPIGLGSYVQWDRRLEGEIARQVLALNAVQGVEIGMGFAASRERGSRVHDELLAGSEAGRVRYASNRSGGINGGMTTGQTLVVRAAMKPIPTLGRPLRSVCLETNEPAAAPAERADTCAVPAAAVIAESLIALVIADALLDKFGGDSMHELLPRVREWNDATRSR